MFNCKSNSLFTDKFVFGSKASTLESLTGKLQNARVLPMLKFSVSKWRTDPDSVIQQSQKKFGTQSLIVRSSSLSEDSEDSSLAGYFTSIPSVLNGPELSNAISTVIESYGQASNQDEVFIQPMAMGITASGVAMTTDPDSGLPYYVINYTLDGDTAAVTSGEKIVQAFIAYKGAEFPRPPELELLFPLLQELEKTIGNSKLDIEFAIDENGPILFQVRPMTAINHLVKSNKEANFFKKIFEAEIEKFGREKVVLNRDKNSKKALFGIMPDWNPAEMIGIKPRPLAFSLYQGLITEMNWASARFRYGYRDLRSKSLMKLFCGTPYIHIPNSFESFIPATLSQDIVDSIMKSCGEFLAKNTHLHDKIEFSVIPTCYTPSLELGKNEFDNVFSSLTKRQSTLYISELKTTTERIISLNGPFFNDLKQISQIKRRIKELINCSDDGLHAFRKAINTAKVVAEIFSGAARAGFIATSILKSIEELGRTPKGFTDSFIASLNTIGKQVSTDFNELSEKKFLTRHGHIRPGTYDIRVNRYDEDKDTYFDWDSKNLSLRSNNQLPSIDRSIVVEIEKAFKECNFNVSIEDFLHFVNSAISAREEVKYLYATLVSESLKRLTIWGDKHGFSRDELSFTTLKDFSYLCEKSDKSLHDAVKNNQMMWNSTRNMRTPDIICEPNDLLGHKSFDSHPNYITRINTESDICVLTGEGSTNEIITDKIVLIENADPGFDWIFTHNIRGFITSYGGENSHMSIRAREFNIPAAIGVGAALFRSLSKSTRLRLDCSDKRIQVIQ